MLKFDRSQELISLLNSLKIKINERFDEKDPLGYHRSQDTTRARRFGENNGLHVNVMSDDEVILSKEPVRLGKFQQTLNGEYYTRVFYSWDDCKLVEKAYNDIKHLPAVPEMKFPSRGVLVQKHKPGETLLRSKNRSEVHKRKLIDFIREMNRIGYCHRDLHCKNIIVSDDELYVIDWDFVAEQKCDLSKAYDLTGQGLESPHMTRRTHIFKDFPVIQIPSVAQLLNITWDDFK